MNFAESLQQIMVMMKFSTEIRFKPVLLCNLKTIGFAIIYTWINKVNICYW